MRSHFTRSLFVAAGLGLLTGCHCCRSAPCTDGGVFPPGPTVGGVPPATGGAFVPPNTQLPPPPPGAVNPGSPAISGFTPMPSGQADLSWRPADAAPPQVQLGAPEPATSTRPNESPRLRPPQIKEDVTPAPKNPAAGVAPGAAPALPVDIPQFAPVKDRVATGRRPALEGLDWLRDNGFRTVLNLRKPGEDDATDRKEVEKRGMKYLSLEVSPQTLTRKLVADFSRLANDAGGYPLFVYDRDGALTGGLWYLHFRLSDGIPDEAARVRARTLGLREDRDAQRDLWQAIQQLLVPPANP